MSKLLEIKDLYGGYQKDVNILQGINLTVDGGEAVGIIGLNGSGKSTLGKAIINQIPFRSGHIIFDGQHVEEKSTYELARTGIALMHQGGAVFTNLSVCHNLQLAWEANFDLDYYKRLKEIIPLLSQPKKKLMRTMADKLSGGQRHELALAMTLARNPKMVILDEPSAGLSPKAVEETYKMLFEIRMQFGITVFLIEQNIQRAIGFCKRCFLMETGVILSEYNELNTKDIETNIF